jgi:hypothetical protein
MNLNQARPLAVSIFAGSIMSLALFISTSLRSAEGAQIVVPNEYQNTEAPAGGAIPTGPFRFQQVFAASQFAGLPSGQRTIVSFAMRPDASVTAPISFTLADTVLKMSTTSRKPGELSTAFSENVGTDEVVVFQGDLSFSIANTGPAEGPKNFDMVLQLQTPFTYDPTKGNLIFELVTRGTELVVSQMTDFVSAPSSIFEEVAAFTEGAQVATGRWGGNVIGFTFVPEPSCVSLFCVGIFTFACCNRRRR